MFFIPKLQTTDLGSYFLSITRDELGYLPFDFRSGLHQTYQKPN